MRLWKGDVVMRRLKLCFAIVFQEKDRPHLNDGKRKNGQGNDNTKRTYYRRLLQQLSLNLLKL